MAERQEGILLYGGGLDSTALLLWLRKVKNFSIAALHVDYGQKAAESEKRAVQYFCWKYNVMWRSIRCEMDKVASAAILKGTDVGTTVNANKLEARNLVLITLAAMWAASMLVPAVYLGFHEEPKERPYPDATKEALSGMRYALRFGMSCDPPRLLAPFYDKPRAEILQIGYDLDHEILHRTFTCYEAGPGECGFCVHCQQKKKMLEGLDVRNRS